MTDLNKTTGLTSLLIASPIISPNGSVDSNPGPTIVNGQPVSAVLELRSTDGALLISRMTTAERDDMNPDDGMLIYNKTDDAFNLRVAGEWLTLVSIDVNGVENDIVVFGATQGSLKDSGVTIADFFPPLESNNINASLAPGNDIAISQLSYVQFVENSGFVFLGLQAGVQLFSQPSPQNICVLITDGGIPPEPSSASSAFEINTRHGALLLSRMVQSDVDNLTTPNDGMMLYNETPKILQLRRNGNNVGVGGVWANVSTNPQNLKVISDDYQILLTDDIIAINTVPDSPITVNLPLNPSAGQTYILYDSSGDADTSFIYANGGSNSINGISPTYDKRIAISNTDAHMNSVILTPGNERAYYSFNDSGQHLITVLQDPLTENPSPVTGIDALGNNPRSIASNSDGSRGYVCTTDSNSIQTISNFTTGLPSAVLSISAQNPWNIAVGGNYAYVTSGIGSGLNVLRLYRGANGGVLVPLSPATITLPETNQVIFSLDGRYAYVTALGGLFVIKDANTDTPSLLTSIPLNTHGAGCSAIALTPDGKYAYIGSLAPEQTTFVIQNVDTDTPTFLTQFSSAACSDHGMAVTNSGQFLYIGDMSGTNVLVYKNAYSGNPVLYKTISGGAQPIEFPYGLVITKDDNYVYTANYTVTAPSLSSRIKDAIIKATLIDDKYDGSKLIYGNDSWNSFHMPSKPGSD